MKNPFFKTMIKAILIAGMAIAVCNCGDDSTSANNDNNGNVNTPVALGEPTRHYNDNGLDVYITEDGRVLDANGLQVGFTDKDSGSIMTMEGATLATGVDFNALPLIPAASGTKPSKVLNAAGQDYVISPAVDNAFDAEGHALGTVTDASGVQTGYFVYITDSYGYITTLDMTVALQDIDLNQYPDYNPTAASSASQQETPIPTPSSETVILTSSDSQQALSSNNQQPASSAQQPKSSASQPKSSDSQPTSSAARGCPEIKYVSGGESGSGHATRYWDCCKPSCSWKENAGDHRAKQCSVNSTTLITDPSSQSVCDGGNAMTCTSQTAFTIEGCDNIGFAFAAVPAFKSACGRCFELTFTGQGKYETKMNHQKLQGKKLIVMASNVGGDVSNGQFDIMIPGGGYGAFDGCSGKMDWGDMRNSERYGGLLSDCENQVGYSGNDSQIYTKRKECLVGKCNSIFAKDEAAKEGCLFLANFMEAAGNPTHTYKEVECPKELADRY